MSHLHHIVQSAHAKLLQLSHINSTVLWHIIRKEKILTRRNPPWLKSYVPLGKHGQLCSRLAQADGKEIERCFFVEEQ